MARRFLIGRDEAEYLVDLLEREDSAIARDLAAEIRAIFGMVPRLDAAEIARFRANLDCDRDCEWREDEHGAALCKRCGSGFTAQARQLLRAHR
jgi:hypothetical protein